MWFVFAILGSAESALSPAIFTLGQAGSVSDPLVLLTSGQKAIEDCKPLCLPRNIQTETLYHHMIT